MVDDHTADVPPSEHMIVLRNDDRPGVIGKRAIILGENTINITDMNVGKQRWIWGIDGYLNTKRCECRNIKTLINTDGVTTVQ